MRITSIKKSGFEEVWMAEDAASNFKAYIALHNTTRGPALGGVRLWSYQDDNEALNEVMRLAEAMTYKSAVANLPFGGGKGVIVMPNGDFDRALLYRQFAEFINHLEGKYITAKDVGTQSDDIALMYQTSKWVTGLPEAEGGAGDPSPITALGVRMGMEVSVMERLDRSSLEDVRVVVQGLGSVGSELVRLLSEQQCDVWASDVDPKRLLTVASTHRLHPLLPEAVWDQDADVFAPCALGQCLNSQTIPALKTFIVAGAANDQLGDASKDAHLLKEREILYAPDFVINSGGLIHVAYEYLKESPEAAVTKTSEIAETLREIFHWAKQSDMTTYQAAIDLAHSRLETV